MPDSIAITTSGPIRGTIRPPGSKSITNRALVCAGLAQGRSVLTGALDSEDTRVMVQALRQLGVGVRHDAEDCVLQVEGCAGQFPVDSADLSVANSGTTIRFLTAACCLGRGRFRLDGTERMRQRPIGDLLDALNQIGANASSERGNLCPPVVVVTEGLAGGEATIRGDISSQYLSGLLLAAPGARSPVHVRIEGSLVSRPYVEMTVQVMSTFGVQVETDSALTSFKVPNTVYEPCDYAIEPDASAASYFWGAAAITGGYVQVEGLGADALQGDVAFCDCLRQMGCEIKYESSGISVTGGSLHGIDIDMNAISDTVQTLAAVALFAQGPTTITGVAHIRHKETDRIGDLARELRKFGATVVELPDGLKIVPSSDLQAANIDTYNDHRMAMSLALVGLGVEGVTINDPGCTEKTYPQFFRDLDGLIRPT